MSTPDRSGITPTRDVLPADERRRRLPGLRRQIVATESVEADLEELISKAFAPLVQHDGGPRRTTRDELEDVREALAASQRDAAEAQEALAYVQSTTVLTPGEITELQVALRDTRSRLQVERQNAAVQRAQQEELAERLAAHESAAASSAREQGELTAALHRLQAIAQNQDMQLRALRAEVNTARAAVPALQSQVERLQTACDQAHDEEARAKHAADHYLREATNREEQLQALRTELALLTRTAQALTEQNAALSSGPPRGEDATVPREVVEELRSDLADVCGERDELRGSALRLERDRDKLRGERDHLYGRVREVEALTAALQTVRNQVAVAEQQLQATVEDLDASDAEVRRLGALQAEAPADDTARELERRLIAAEAEIVRLRQHEAEAMAADPSGVELEALEVAHANQLRMLETHRAADRAHRKQAEERAAAAEAAQALAASAQRATAQRAGELMRKIDVLSAKAGSFDDLARAATSSLAIAPKSREDLPALVARGVAELKTKLEAADGQVTVLRQELEAARRWAVAQTGPVVPPQPAASPAISAVDAPQVPVKAAEAVPKGNGTRADNLLEMLRQATEAARASAS